MKKVSLKKLREAAKTRPPAYMAAVLAVSRAATPEHVYIEDKDFERLQKEYPRPSAAQHSTPDTKHGPGTELKRLLAGFPFYIKTTPNCRCNARARQMDVWGIEGCEERADLIVGWLKEEAERRNLLFIDAAGRLLLRKAIAAARKTRNV